ncbi:MAG TPA: DNA cytosine methyltransferase [Candidatus Obscuribacterales bacterium]
MLQGLTALEFYSGIGAFHQAAAAFGIEIAAAFDQDERANATYARNWGLNPNPRNLDTISISELPAADIWWLSPPCTPFTVRGKQRDLDDPRTRSLINLSSFIPRSAPPVVLLENVYGFEKSKTFERLSALLKAASYALSLVKLCPTMFGVPMRRPRLYCIATTSGASFVEKRLPQVTKQTIANFIDADYDPALEVDRQLVERYARSWDIIDPGNPEACAICFTKGYWKCMKASGSFIQLSDQSVRRFSPKEIIRLLGFDDRFQFSPLPVMAQLQLVGNSVDVRAIKYLLSCLSFG